MLLNTKRARTVLIVSAAFGLSTHASAQRLAKPSGTQRQQQQMMNDVPRCARKLGTLSVMDGDDPSGWTQFQLTGPQKLIKVLVQRSGCFNLVDRGSGLSAAQRERDIGTGLGLQRRSNVGRGQIKVGGRLGAVAGGIKTRKMEANTVLSLTNVRTTETIAVQDGYAAKNSLSFGGGGFFGGGVGAIGGGYDSTDIGRIVTLAFIQAYSKMVTDLGLVTPGSAGTAEASPAKISARRRR
jgi:hypothetical protein